MLLTVLEIVVFMAAAAVIGVLLGWVLRGSLGNEQKEISDLRNQLRKLKKEKREAEAASKAEKAAPSATTSTEASTVDTPVTEEEQVVELVKDESEEQAEAARESKKTSSKPARKSSSARKTQAEREADQEAGRQAFMEVMQRVGASDAEDKLTKIYGIGKRYAEMLNEQGITSYEQLSKLKKAEVRTLAAALGVLDDRLETEDWVGSAKKLLKETAQ